MKKIKSGIYGIFCSANNKWYIGQSYDLSRRKTDHFRSLKLQKAHNQKLQNAYNKYGKDQFEFIILELFDLSILGSNTEKREFLTIYEIHYQEKYDSIENGFNIRVSAESNLGVRYDDNHKQKLSERYHSLSEEDKKKRYDIVRGRKMSPESRAKMAEAAKLRSQDPEYIKKISEAVKRRWADPEYKEKHGKRLASYNDNRIYSEEHRRKIGEAAEKRRGLSGRFE